MNAPIRKNSILFQFVLTFTVPPDPAKRKLAWSAEHNGIMFYVPSWSWFQPKSMDERWVCQIRSRTYGITPTAQAMLIPAS